MLHVLNQQYPGAAAGLLTTTNEAFDRVAMHAVRRELLEAQAEAARAAASRRAAAVAVFERAVRIDHDARPSPASSRDGFTHVAFGDLFLEDVRRYREDAPRRHRARAAVSDLEDQADRRSRARHDRRRAAGAADLRRSAQARSVASPAARSIERCWPTCRPASIRAARTANSIRSRSRARCSTTPIDVELGEVVDRDGFVFADLKLTPCSLSSTFVSRRRYDNRCRIRTESSASPKKPPRRSTSSAKAIVSSASPATRSGRRRRARSRRCRRSCTRATKRSRR